MKKSRFNRFASGSRSTSLGMLLAIAGYSTTPAFAVNTTGLTNTYNGSLNANGMATGGNWTAGSPFSASGAGAYADLVFTGAASGSTFTTSGGGSTFMNAESYNVTDGNSYALQINSTTAARFNVGATSNTGTSTVVLPFTNSVSNVAQDLIYLSNGSRLMFNATNGEGGTAATLPLIQAGNFNVGTGSILTVNPAITGTPALTITGSGTTIFSGANTYSGATTVSGGSLEISGTHSGTGAITLSNGLLKISGTRSGTGATTVRYGTLEISGTNAGTSYTVSNSVDNVGVGEPVLKLSNVGALPVTAKITGSTSSLRDGTVDLAVAGAYTVSSYETGNISFTASSGSPTSLTFSDASKITTGVNGARIFSNSSVNLSLVFGSTLDIGGDVNAGDPVNVTIGGTGNTTVTAGVISTGLGVRSLNKTGTGTLILIGISAYTGSTRVMGGVLRLGNEFAIPGGIGATGGTSNLVFGATTAVIGLDRNFLRTLGPGIHQVTANPTADPLSGQRMGFAAFGGDHLVDFGAPVILSATSAAGVGLTLGAAASDGKVTVVNDMNLSGSARTVQVNDGSAAVDAELSGVVSSGGGTLVKTGDGTLALSGTNTHGDTGGGTQVLAGVLLVDGDSLSDTSNLVIDGGKVGLTGSEIVKTLFFGAAPQPAGTYGPLGSVLPIIATANLTGSGTLVVTTDPVAGDAYTTWATSFGLENPWVTMGNPALNGEPNADPDGDGVSNKGEYAFGLRPTSGASSNPIASQLNKTTGKFSYTRRATPVSTGLTYTVTSSIDLVGWPNDELATAGQMVTGTVDGVETVEVTLSGAPLTDARRFVRIKAE